MILIHVGPRHFTNGVAILERVRGPTVRSDEQRSVSHRTVASTGTYALSSVPDETGISTDETSSKEAETSEFVVRASYCCAE